MDFDRNLLFMLGILSALVQSLSKVLFNFWELLHDSLHDSLSHLFEFGNVDEWLVDWNFVLFCGIITTYPSTFCFSRLRTNSHIVLALLVLRTHQGENAQNAKQVATKILQDAGVNVDQLRLDVETYLNKQPKVTITGDTTMVNTQQKSMGRVLAEVLDKGQEVRSKLKVSITVFTMKEAS